MKTARFPKDRIPSIRVVMMPRDTNALGTIFGGVILSQIDMAAAVEALRHHPGKTVTVAMDKVEFRQPVFVGDVVSFYTEKIRIGTTSITIRVEVWSERRLGGGENVFVTEAQVTLVAVGKSGRPIPIGSA